MNQSNREQVVSSDLNRIGNLAGRELMDAAQSRGVRADFYAPASNAFDDFSAAAKTANAVPLSGTTQPPSLDGIAASFDMNVGAGEGFLPSASPSPDFSGNQLLRWPAQRVSWPGGGTPDATNPKICLIVATPADALADDMSRNILTDPATRATVPATVYKTSNPVAQLSVVAGTSAAAPVAPAAPANSLVLFQVYVPALATASTAFLPVRQAWRNIEFPGTSQHGIVKGCVPTLSLTNPYLILGAGAVQRIVIDGELLTFQGNGSAGAKADTVTAPTSAPAGNDKPYYLYLCGGRNQPVLNYDYATPGWLPVPVYLVISGTPPDDMGYPKAGLAISTPTLIFPRAACCYIGLAFYGASGSTNVPAFYDGDWIYSRRMLEGLTVASVAPGFAELTITTPEVGYTAWTLASRPAISTAVDLFVAYEASGTNTAIVSGGGGDDAHAIVAIGPSTQTPLPDSKRVRISSAQAAALFYKGVQAGSLTIRPTAYNMNIPRLAR
jgi:hypothetical protein